MHSAKELQALSLIEEVDGDFWKIIILYENVREDCVYCALLTY